MKDLEGAAGLEALFTAGADAAPKRLTPAQRSLLLGVAESSTGILRVVSPGLWSYGFAKRSWITGTVAACRARGLLENCEPSHGRALRITQAGRAEAARLAAEEGA